MNNSWRMCGAFYKAKWVKGIFGNPQLCLILSENNAPISSFQILCCKILGISINILHLSEKFTLEVIVNSKWHGRIDGRLTENKNLS